MKRNIERYTFLKWGFKKRLTTFRVVPQAQAFLHR